MESLDKRNTDEVKRAKSHSSDSTDRIITAGLLLAGGYIIWRMVTQPNGSVKSSPQVVKPALDAVEGLGKLL